MKEASSGQTFCLVWSCCQISAHMVLVLVDHEVSFHPALLTVVSLCMIRNTSDTVTSSRCLHFEICAPH